MAVTLGSNVSAVRAIGRLSQSSATFTRALERVSSGMRINRASDDPAGLATSSVLNQKSRVLTRAVSNLSDGISVLNVADGALDQVSQTLTRMIELSEQAANGSFSRTQRISLNREFAALSRELERIADATQFNGTRLLAGRRRDSVVQNLVDQTDNANDVSANGRYVATIDTNTPESFQVYDTTTGVRRTIAGPVSGQSAQSIRITNSGSILATMNGVGEDDLYFYDARSGEWRKLTNSQAGQRIGSFIAISADESTIAFTSQTYYQDGGTVNNVIGSGGSERLVTLDLATGTVRTSAQTVSSQLGLVLSADGQTVGFSSNANLTGQNADGNFEIFTASIGGSAFSITQASSTTGSNNYLRGITSEGRLLFTSNGNFTGDNAGGSMQLYESDLRFGNFIQRTNFSGVESFLSVGTDGNTVSFISGANRTGENPLGYTQVFRTNFATGRTEQLSNFTAEEPIFSVSNFYVSSDGSTFTGHDTGGDPLLLVDLSKTKNSLDFEAGFGARGRIVTDLDALSSAIRGLGQYSITSAQGARTALDSMREALQNVSATRGTIGAGLSRIEAAIIVTGAQNLETQAATGRIRDIDIASEAAEVARAKILQQVGTTLLASINQQPALAVTLLRS